MTEPNEPIIAWMGYWSGAGSVDSVTKTTHFERVANEWKADGAQITPLVAARRPAPAGAEVGVAIQWEPESGLGFHHGDTPFGSYTIMPDLRKNYPGPVRWRVPNEADFAHEAATADEAKAACRADFEQRIRSALLSPPVEPQGEAVAFIVHDDPELGAYLTRSRQAADASGKRVTPLYAAPPSPQSREGARETGWLCEWLHATGPEWWSLGDATSDGGYFTKDSLKALRFGRKEDAQAYIEEAGWTEIVPTEHEWVGPPRALSPQER